MPNAFSIHMGVNDYKWWRGIPERRLAWMWDNYADLAANKTIPQPWELRAFPDTHSWTRVSNLANCVKDACAMEQLAEDAGFGYRFKLEDDEATATNFFKAWTVVSRSARAGDIVLLTFAGHGVNADDDGVTTTDTGWLLYDAWLKDDVLRLLFRGLRPGVRLFIVSDSCQSGGMLDDDDDVDDPMVNSVFRFRMMLNESTLKDFYEAFIDRHLDGDRASTDMILLLAAVSYEDTALDGVNGQGYFTEKLLQVWNEGSFTGDHRAFFHAVDDRIKADGLLDWPGSADVWTKNIKKFLPSHRKWETLRPVLDTMGHPFAAPPPATEDFIEEKPFTP